MYKQILASNSNFIILGNDNRLYIVGKKWGYFMNPDEFDINNVYDIEIQLDDDELITSFYMSTMENIAYVHTSNKKLFIFDSNFHSKHSKSLKKNRNNYLDDNWPKNTDEKFVYSYLNETNITSQDLESFEKPNNDESKNDDDTDEMSNISDNDTSDNTNDGPIDQESSDDYITNDESNDQESSDDYITNDESNDQESSDDYIDSSLNSEALFDEYRSNRMLHGDSSSDIIHNYYDKKKQLLGCYESGHPIGISFGDLINGNGYIDHKDMKGLGIMTPFSIKPIKDVDEIMFCGVGIFFRKGNKYFVHYQQIKTDLQFKRYVHKTFIRYYKVHIPKDYVVQGMKNNIIHMRKNNKHRIVTFFEIDSEIYPKPTVFKFLMQEIDTDSLFTRLFTCSTHYIDNNTLFEYYDQVKQFVPVIFNRRIIISNNHLKTFIYFRDDNGDLYYRNSNKLCSSHRWLENIVKIIPRKNKPIILVNRRSKSFHRLHDNCHLINIRRYKKIVICGLFSFDNPKGKNNALFIGSLNTSKKSKKYFTKLDYSSISLHEFDEEYVGKIDRIICDLYYPCTSSLSIILETSKGTLYLPAECEKIGEHVLLYPNSYDNIQTDVIDHVYKERNESKSHSIILSVDIAANKFQMLLSFSDIYSKSTGFNIQYTKRGKYESSGKGTSRTFIQDAMSSFFQQYLEYQDGRVRFKLDAWKDLNCYEIYRIGNTITRAFSNTDICLSIRLPLEFSAAIIGRPACMDELHYFLNIINPDIYKKADEMRNDPNFAEITGYPTFDDYVKACLNWETEDFDKHMFIANCLAETFLESYPINNLSRTTIPTIDYMLSGTYTINRFYLISKIVGDGPVNFIKNLIKTLSEYDLATLLRNWIGTSILIDCNYIVSDSFNDKINFCTCRRELKIKSKLLKDDYNKQIITDILITPISNIEN